MGRTQAQAFYEFHEQAITPLKNRVTNLENTASDTAVNSSAMKVFVGTTQPTDTSVIWINTSNYGG